jgi:hypothetical protein
VPREAVPVKLYPVKPRSVKLYPVKLGSAKRCPVRVFGARLRRWCGNVRFESIAGESDLDFNFHRGVGTDSDNIAGGDWWWGEPVDAPGAVVGCGLVGRSWISAAAFGLYVVAFYLGAFPAGRLA